MEVALHIPDDVVDALAWQDISRHLLEQLALEGYQTGRLSEEQIGRLLGYETRLEVHSFLKKHGVSFQYTLEDLDHDGPSHEEMHRSASTPPPAPPPEAGHFVPRTPVAKDLWELRQAVIKEALERGEPLLHSWDDVRREVHERRGERDAGAHG